MLTDRILGCIYRVPKVHSILWRFPSERPLHANLWQWLAAFFLSPQQLPRQLHPQGHCLLAAGDPLLVSKPSAESKPPLRLAALEVFLSSWLPMLTGSVRTHTECPLDSSAHRTEVVLAAGREGAIYGSDVSSLELWSGSCGLQA